jgi:hypothetical protein
MELGGNLNAAKYYEDNQLYMNGQHDFISPLAIKYRKDLRKNAEIKAQNKDIIIKEEMEEAKNEEIKHNQVEKTETTAMPVMYTAKQ